MQAIFHAQFEDISIHAPRTGSDIDIFNIARHAKISIHAPRTGSDPSILCQFVRHFLFQSTLPARGATISLILY